MEEELGYHAYCREMHAKVVALRYEMRKHWTLPNERQLRYTGPDWPVHLLNSVDSDARAKVLLLFWCAYVAHPERRHAWDRLNSLNIMRLRWVWLIRGARCQKRGRRR
jgi:hypothetical protein